MKRDGQQPSVQRLANAPFATGDAEGAELARMHALNDDEGLSLFAAIFMPMATA